MYKLLYICKRKAGMFIFYILLIVLLIVFREWIHDALFTQKTISYCDNLDECINDDIQNGDEITQSFVTRGHTIEQIFFSVKSEDNFKVNISLMDGDNIVCENDQEVQGNGTDYIRVFLYPTEKLKIFHKYKIKISFDVDEEYEGAKLCVIPARNGMIKNENKINKEINFFFSYLDYFSVLGFLLFLFIISMVIVLLHSHICIRANYVILVKELMGCVTAILGYFTIEWIMGNIGNISISGIMKNSIPILLFYFLISAIFDSEKIAAVTTYVVCIFVGSVNHYVVLFRARPVLPGDILSIKTAVSVAGNYAFLGSYEILIAICLAVLLLIILRKIAFKKSFYISNFLFYSIQFLLISFVYINNIMPLIDAQLWDLNANYSNEGTVASFIAYVNKQKYQKPDGYSVEKCEDIIENEKVISANTSTKAQNIIVIMDESLANYNSSMFKGKLKEDYMPFINSLEENCIKGNLYVSTLAGGTANTEFEVLTGNSCEFISGVPYQTNINRDMYTFATEIKKNNFITNAFHPFMGKNYNRDVVYKRFGFDNFYTQDNLTDYETMRWMVSDKSDFDWIERIDNEIEPDLFFMFNVTMQNHGGYEPNDSYFGGTDLSYIGKYPCAEMYLSLVKETDNAFKDLVDYYSGIDEPTLICMFGDHQPNLEEGFVKWLLGAESTDLTDEENTQKYVTPFVIWTNYDIQEQYIEKISANYLSTLIMLNAGYDLNGYWSFLYQLYQKYPVISAAGNYDIDNNFFYSIDEIEDDDLKYYKQLQYYRMKGNE